MGASGSQAGPSLVGVGAAAVDFQVGTGRMPMQMNGPQAYKKPAQFNEDADPAAGSLCCLARAPARPSPKQDVLDEKGDAAKGGELFRINCAMCHNAAAAGGALTRGKFAPALADVSGKHIYEAMVTGPQNMPVFNDANISPEGKRDIITFLKQIEANGSPGGADLVLLGPVSEGLLRLDCRPGRHHRLHDLADLPDVLGRPGTCKNFLLTRQQFELKTNPAHAGTREG